MFVFQDTNALAMKCIPSILGVSASEDYEMNSVCVPRTPGEAMGAICKLVNEKSGKELVINVEYNQLDALLKP
jgi:UDP-sugar pyrophosphorylase